MNTLLARWHKAEDVRPPTARCGHIAVVVDKTEEFGTELVVIHGGINLQKRALDDLSVLQVEEQQWLPLKPAAIGPAARAFHAACTIGKDVYVFAGHVYLPEARRLHQFNDLWALDTTTWEWHRQEASPDAPCPSPRDRSSMVALDDHRLLVYGGADAQGRRLDDSWIYDITNQSWTELSPIGKKPSARCSAAMFVLGSRVLVFGGDVGSPVGDLWSLRGVIPETARKQEGHGFVEANASPSKDSSNIVQWRKVDLPGHPPIPRRGHAVALVKPWGVIICGGLSEHSVGILGMQKHAEYRSDVVLMSIRVEGNAHRQLSWVEADLEGNLQPKPREKHSLCALQDGRILLFGGTDGKTTLGDFWWLQLEDLSEVSSPRRLESLTSELLDLEFQLGASDHPGPEVLTPISNETTHQSLQTNAEPSKGSYWSSLSSLPSSLQQGMPALAASLPSGVTAALNSLSSLKTGRFDKTIIAGVSGSQTASDIVHNREGAVSDLRREGIDAPSQDDLDPRLIDILKRGKDITGPSDSIATEDTHPVSRLKVSRSVAKNALRVASSLHIGNSCKDVDDTDDMLRLGGLILAVADGAFSVEVDVTVSKDKQWQRDSDTHLSKDASCKSGEDAIDRYSKEDCMRAARGYFLNVSACDLPIGLVGVLLHDYCRLACTGWRKVLAEGGIEALLQSDATIPGRFCHMRVDAVRLRDVPVLLRDYYALLELICENAC